MLEIGNKTTIKEYANDLWITTQVKGLAAKTIGLRALSYNFETIKGKVFVVGIFSSVLKEKYKTKPIKKVIILEKRNFSQSGF